MESYFDRWFSNIEKTLEKFESKVERKIEAFDSIYTRACICNITCC
jgi:hypothetical protein